MSESSATPSTFELDARLQVTAAEHGQKRQFPIGLPTVEGMELVVGRSRSVDLTLHDDFVSNRHLKVVFRGGKHWVEDLGSTHGTRVNDIASKGPTPLTSRDLIALGKSSLQYLCTKRPIEHLQKAEAPAQASASPSDQPQQAASPNSEATLATKADGPAKGPAAAAAAKAARKSSASRSGVPNTAQEDATRVDVSLHDENTTGGGAGKVLLAVLVIAGILALLCYLAWQLFFTGNGA